ncbi:MAG: hypothetical protein ABR583_04980 [Gaiellaceae bacterium]
MRSLALLALTTAALAGATSLAAAESTPGVLVVYQETGGSANLDRRLSVKGDGRLVAKSEQPVVASCSSRLASGQLRTLRRALKNSDFATLAAQYGSDPDAVTSRIRYAGRTVRAQRGSEPVRLRSATELLRRLLVQRLALCRKLGR